jgi:D-glycero-D-manno-heptose 1,7-bisphosphate phosphatase
VIPRDIPKIKIDFFKETLSDLVSNGSKVYCLYHQGLVRDIGTPMRLLNAENDLANAPKILERRRGLLLDRDGTLIEDIPYNIDSNKVKLLAHSKELMKRSRKFDFIAVITNQPLVARGDGLIADVKIINQKMEQLLGMPSFVNAFYICPHHPDSGFDGEIAALKHPCKCRKPEVELLLQAALDGKFFLTNALYVGDSTVDITAAIKVGASWIHIHKEIDGQFSSCLLEKFGNGKCVFSSDIVTEMEAWNDSFESTA